MYVSTRIVRNSVLCSFIFASVSAFQIAKADKIINYTVPSKGSVYGNVATATGQESWSVNSRKVRTTGYGAAASANASRSSYGFVGKMTVSRAFFQAWLAYEIGSLGLEWIASQYELADNETLDKDLNINKEIEAYNYLCDIEQCYYKVRNARCDQNHYATLFAAAAAAQNCAIEETNSRCLLSTTEYCTYTTNFNNENFSYTVNFYNKNTNAWGGGNVYNATKYGSNTSTSLGKQKYNDKHPAGEPTKAPDTYMTAAILDRWAHIVPEMRQRVSDYVDFMPEKSRYTEKDVLGNVLKDYEGVLEPVKEPIANPHKTAKRPEPEIEPTPQLKTKDLLNGNEIIQPTEPIKEPITKEDLTKLPNSDKEVDLSKIEDAVTKIGAEPADTPVPDLELSEWGEIEIPTPEATDDQIAEQAGKIRKTVTEQQVINKAEELIGMHSFNYETFGKSRACPPPRKMRFLTVEFDLPFDLYCDYIKQIVLLMIGLIPLGVFIYFLRNLFIHG